MCASANALVKVQGRIYGKNNDYTIEKLFSDRKKEIESERKAISEPYALGMTVDAKTGMAQKTSFPKKGREYLEKKLDDLEKKFSALAKRYIENDDPAKVEKEFKIAEQEWLNYQLEKEALIAYYKGVTALKLQMKAANQEMEKYWDAYSDSMNVRAKRAGAHIWKEGAEKERTQVPNPEYEAIMHQLETAKKEFNALNKALATRYMTLLKEFDEDPAKLLKYKKIEDRLTIVPTDTYINTYSNSKQILNECASFSFALIINSGDPSLIKQIIPTGDILYETDPSNPLAEKKINPLKEFTVVIVKVLRSELETILDKTVGYTKNYATADPENAKKIKERYERMTLLLEKAKTSEDVITAIKDLEPVRTFASGAISKTMEWELVGTEKVKLIATDVAAIATSIILKNPIIADVWFTLKGGFLAGYGIKTSNLEMVNEGLVLMGAFAVPSAGRIMVKYSKSMKAFNAGQMLVLTGIGFQTYFATEMTAGIAKSAIDMGKYGSNPSDIIDIMSNSLFLGMMARGLPRATKEFGKSKIKEEFFRLIDEKHLRMDDNVAFGGKEMTVREVMNTLHKIATEQATYGKEKSSAAINLLEIARRSKSENVKYMASLKLKKIKGDALPEETGILPGTVGGMKITPAKTGATPKSLANQKRTLERLGEIKKELKNITDTGELRAKEHFWLKGRQYKYTEVCNAKNRETAESILKDIEKYEISLEDGQIKEAEIILAEINNHLNEFSRQLELNIRHTDKTSFERQKIILPKSRPAHSRRKKEAPKKIEKNGLPGSKELAQDYRTAGREILDQEEQLKKWKYLNEVERGIKQLIKDGTSGTIYSNGRKTDFKITLSQKEIETCKDILNRMEEYRKQMPITSKNRQKTEEFMKSLNIEITKLSEMVETKTRTANPIYRMYTEGSSISNLNKTTERYKQLPK
jgi:hypothetical protein